MGCKEDEPPRAPPPPPPAAKPDACAGGGGKIADATSAPFFPRTAGGFCLDPNGSEKTFGEGAAHPLDGICDMFDGECEIYKGFNVRRVVEAQIAEHEHPVRLERLETGVRRTRVEDRRSVRADCLGADCTSQRLELQSRSHDDPGSGDPGAILRDLTEPRSRGLVRSP